MKTKLSLIPLTLVFICTIGCMTQQQANKTTSVKPSTTEIQLDVSNTSNFNYGKFKHGFAYATDLIGIAATNYNPLRYRITALGTGTMNFMNNNSPLNSYVTINPPTVTVPTVGSPLGPGSLPPSDVNSLKAIVNTIDVQGNQMSKTVSTLSKFCAIIVHYQNDIDNWKKLTMLTKSTVDNRKKDTYDALGRLILSYFAAGSNPYQPALGSVPNCNFAPYMIVDFPPIALKDLKDQIAANKIALNQLTIFENNHSADMNAYLKAIGIADDFVLYKTQVNDISSQIQKFISRFEENQIPKLSQFASSASLIETLEYTTYLGPFSLQDNDEIKIKISKTDMNNNLDDWSGFPGIILKKRGGIKIDFSAGLFVSNLSDRNFVASQSTQITQDSIINNGVIEIKPNQTTFSKVIKRGGSTISYGPMAFVHFHSMNPSFLNYGAFIGTGFMFKDSAKPVIAIGGNLMMVNYQRLILGFGAAIGSVKRLSSKYQENGSYREAITDVATEDRIYLKGMFSLSWNISK